MSDENKKPAVYCKAKGLTTTEACAECFQANRNRKNWPLSRPLCKLQNEMKQLCKDCVTGKAELNCVPCEVGQ